MAKTNKDDRELIVGDVVKFKKTKRILLNKTIMSTGIEIYHIYHPERGVYSAYREELVYIDHLESWDNIIKEFNTICMDKSA